MAASGQSGREKLNFQLTLRRRGISDQAILRALEDVPRDLFVDPRDREFAYADTALGIACGQTISQPYVVAYMTEQLRTHPRHRVLEIGTGSGYQAAVLSRLCRIVVTVERYRTLVDTARRRFSSLGYNNIEVVFGDGYDVAQTLGMFDRIIVTAAMEEIPESLMELLEPGGILIAPVGPQGGAQQLVRLRKTEEGIARDELIHVRFVPALKGLAKEL
ncbi:MAG: protein-L-isoaspartate(D-aspartate) O-methyltransferase [Afipia felis]|nr:protein-L-isoaspartate(D-aspartate) O-methyltransferase [Afipia felis]